MRDESEDVFGVLDIGVKGCRVAVSPGRDREGHFAPRNTFDGLQDLKHRYALAGALRRDLLATVEEALEMTGLMLMTWTLACSASRNLQR